MQKTITQYVKTASPGSWLKGSGWNECLWDSGRPPCCKDLDKFSPKNPLYCQHISHHICVTNSLGLRLAKITKDTPDPEGGSIGHFDNGEPNGLFYDRAAIALLEHVMPETCEEEHIKALETSGAILNRFGITQVMNSMMTCDEMRAYLQARKQNRLSYRANLMFSLDRSLGDVHVQAERIKQMTAVTGFGDDMVKMAGIKIILDGVMSAGTAALREEYEYISGRGSTSYSAHDLKLLAQLAGKYHWQVGIHCCGDRSADMAMDMFEQTCHPQDRHFIIHLTLAHPDQISRLKASDISLALQPAINTELGEQAVIGQKYSNLYMPLQTLFREGIIVGGSSDAPVVTCSPFAGMASAVERHLSDGSIHRPNERISIRQALLMWTRGSAYLCHTENTCGKIAAGALADYIIIDTPLLSASADEIRHTRVLHTILGGKTVYQI